jgi:mono/diheme cytochrome c family protein
VRRLIVNRNKIATLVLFMLALSPGAFAVEPVAALWTKAKCALCHGKDGSGDTKQGKEMKVPDLRSEAVQKLTDDEIAKAVAGGHLRMPAFSTQLKPDEVRLLTQFIRDLAKPAK